MKPIAIVFFVCVAISVFPQASNGAETERIEKVHLGFLQRLVEIKIDVETKMVSLMNSDYYKTNILDSKELIDEMLRNDSAIVDDADSSMQSSTRKATNNRGKPSKQEINQRYITLKKTVDQLIIQLIGDMKRKNSIRIYKKIDNYYKGEGELTRYPAYAGQLDLIDKLYKRFMRYPPRQRQQGGRKSLELTIGEITPVDAAVLIHDIITGIRDFKAKKVDDISTILDGLRLKAIGELDDKEKEEGKD